MINSKIAPDKDLIESVLKSTAIINGFSFPNALMGLEEQDLNILYMYRDFIDWYELHEDYNIGTIHQSILNNILFSGEGLYLLEQANIISDGFHAGVNVLIYAFV